MTSGSAAALRPPGLGTIAGVVYDDVSSSQRRTGERGISGDHHHSGREPSGPDQTALLLFTGLVEGATVQETDLADCASTTSTRPGDMDEVPTRLLGPVPSLCWRHRYPVFHPSGKALRRPSWASRKGWEV